LARAWWPQGGIRAYCHAELAKHLAWKFGVIFQNQAWL
jgi:hypothetical protein